MPNGVLLDDERRLVHIFGDPAKYVQLKAGRASGDSLDSFAPSSALPPPPRSIARPANWNRFTTTVCNSQKTMTRRKYAWQFSQSKAKRAI